jgi:two-component system, sensor histidine kinase PdtaS
MPASNSPQADWRHAAPKRVTLFQQPENCPVTMCSAIAMYEQELERHRATESKLQESVLRESDLLHQKDELIQQKDIIAKESEHRLLNGLQLITSLLAVQSRGTKNPDAAAQLTIAANRVATLGRVHRHLHALDKLESVEFKQFLEKLCHDLADMASNEFSERSLCVEGAELKIPSVTAIPLGFIASELITNSIKYARGKITVSLQTTPSGGGVLSVSDDGPGLPAAFDLAATHGLGMKIIATLVRQIHGELSFTKGGHGQGTRFSVLFNPQAWRS